MYTIGKKEKKPLEIGAEARAHRTPEPDNPSAKYRRLPPAPITGGHSGVRKRMLGLRRAQ